MIFIRLSPINPPIRGIIKCNIPTDIQKKMDNFLFIFVVVKDIERENVSILRPIATNIIFR